MRKHIDSNFFSSLLVLFVFLSFVLIACVRAPATQQVIPSSSLYSNNFSDNVSSNEVISDKIIISYSTWIPDTHYGGEKKEICIEKLGCKACYNEYRNIASYETRCCDEAGCISTCGPFPDIEKHNAEADIILCMCEKTNNDMEIIEQFLNNYAVSNYLSFRNDDLCQPQKMYAE